MNKIVLLSGIVVALIVLDLQSNTRHETRIPKGIHANIASVARDIDTGLPLTNRVKNPVPEDASPRGSLQ